MTRPLIYPGYPTRRLVIEDINETTNLTLPDGEWSTGVYEYPTPEQQEALQAKGYELDDFGRPLHPRLREMLSTPEIGVVTGRGFYWNWGPNYAADPIIINTDADPKILLIKRGDTGDWALPGGFVDGNESGAEAAKRELFEETGLVITGKPVEIYSGAVVDLRTTAHAWCETTAVLWRINGTPNVRGLDDAIDAAWVPASELSGLFGSHRKLVEQALQRLDEAIPTYAMSSPEMSTSYSEVSGGHMTYHRHIIKTGDYELFIKSHDSGAFTDSTREAHSRQYLEKEKLLYDHLENRGLSITPQSVYLVNGHNLIMQALSPEQGWHWRAPVDSGDKYIADAIAALSQLQSAPLLDNFHDTILPTHETHIGEGWNAITPESINRFREKIVDFIPRMKPDFHHAASLLTHNLEQLQNRFAQITPPESYYLCHHDIRQANIAWHADQGLKIVDWSWAGKGRENSDSTTLLIDLHKSGLNVSKYMEYFNDDHALTLIGFWLAHSLWPSRSDDNSVRFHQVLSAVSAYDLLMKRR